MSMVDALERNLKAVSGGSSSLRLTAYLASRVIERK